MEQVHILLVDTDKASNEAFALALKAENFTPHLAHTKAEALHLLSQEDSPDLMVLCLDLAAENDFSLLQDIKKNYPQKQILLSSDHEQHEHLAGNSFTGAYTILPKPIEVQVLKENLGLSLIDKMEGALVAASLAQAGAFAEADETLNEMEIVEDVAAQAESALEKSST